MLIKFSGEGKLKIKEGRGRDDKNVYRLKEGCVKDTGEKFCVGRADLNICNQLV